MNNGSKMRLSLIVLLVMAIASGFASYAWLSGSTKEVRTDYLRVETPPILYVCDNEANGNESARIINLDNMVLGETQRIVFCVVPRANDLVTKYDLELVYTDNMKEIIDLYKVTEIGTVSPASGLYETVTSENGTFYYTYDAQKLVSTSATAPTYQSGGSNIPYDGVYQIYKNQLLNFNTGVEKTNLPGNPDNIHMSCYVLEISWENGQVPDGVDEKEVDMIYIVVKG